MRIYLQPPQPSRALQRIADALTRYKPEWVEVVGTQAEAELVIIYAIGRRDQVQRQVDYLLSTGREYAVIQVCLRSTLSPRVIDWLYIWHSAVAVWSYYDLQQAMIDDSSELGHSASLVDYYHAPLGVDAEVFYPRPLVPVGLKDFIVLTSGKSRLSESVRECWLAATTLGRLTAHIGASGHMAACSSNYRNQTDDQLAWIYSQCKFVSALRRKEGFELPAAEGLLCGARPICFSTPDFKWIYKNWAEYIYEGTRQEVVDQLVELFRRDARPVTTEEIAEARKWFHWPTVVGGFYERLR